MITLLTNTYSEKELEAIAEITEECVIMLESIYCKQMQDEKFDCNYCECEYRHICYDLQKLHAFAVHKLTEKKSR
ncbi:MAG: hypothetical protein J6S23_02685 [Clostridia bacterium]|nr:hypothetical protein [Clostridia bacterium]